MIFDGRALARNWQDKLKAEVKQDSPALAVVLVGDDPASQTFTKIKQKFGEAIGVEVWLREYEASTTTDELVAVIEQLNNDNRCGGVVVQLPLPPTIDTNQVIAAIDPVKDVDALGADSSFDPPVTRALAEILQSINFDPAGRPALVIGRGRLVGRPAAVWLTQAGAEVAVADENTANLKAQCLAAEIIVSGAGQAHLITPDMVKTGSVLIDFGTSRGEAGKIVGDFDPGCAETAALLTPTPGGTGPVTVAMLFANLLRG